MAPSAKTASSDLFYISLDPQQKIKANFDLSHCYLQRIRKQPGGPCKRQDSKKPSSLAEYVGSGWQKHRADWKVCVCVCVVCGVPSTARAVRGPGCTCVLCGRPQEKERQWDSIPHWWLRGPKLGEAGWALIMQRRGRILVFSKWQTLLGKRKEADTSCSLPKLLTRRESSVRHGKRKEQNIPFPGIIEVVCTVLLGEKKILPPNQYLQNYVLTFSKEKSHYPMWI